MKLIFSPARKMKPCDDHGLPAGRPPFQAERDTLIHRLAALPKARLAALYPCSPSVFESFYAELLRQDQGLSSHGSPALLCYRGIAFSSMSPDVFSADEWHYVQDHLIILSALYGALRPLDSICPYRMEMSQKLPFDLYAFWKKKLRPLFEDEVVINLASREYARVIEKARLWIDIRFYEEENGTRREKGVYVKMARGAMVRWMAARQIERPEDLRAFHELGYTYDPAASSAVNYVFVRKANPHD